MTAAVESYLAARFEQYLAELRAFCAIPSVSTQPAHKPDVERAARFVADRLAQAGLSEVGVHPTAGHPVVTGAWRGADAESAAAAAAFASAAAARVFTETHQLSGAIGYTLEHDLHVFSMRLQALRLELGGVGAHRRALASARWVAAR